ncbi:murein hydrolase activator EnvC family protein [Thalassobaculum salexigens]|uniref:murein hydrolase activator EnvC family protein n=1 Tax=Thalassobaculum salexigens TaxID=455360 RepID=UPI00041559E5|nr:peptidoglycan DD-metalloendopeptidase family protein [Thalassobaculum salexigens]
MRSLAPVLVLAMLAAAVGGNARAQTAEDPAPKDPTAELRRIEKALEGERKAGTKLDRLAGALAGEIDRLRERMAVAATRAQRTETDMFDAEQTLDTLRQEVKDKRSRLLERRQELSHLTGALQRLARHPPETLLLVGRAPLDTVHTGILLESAIPRLNGNARALRRELDTLATLEADIRAQRDRLTLAAQELDAERAQLAALAAEKAELLAGTRNRASNAAEEIRALSQSARSLRELIDSLEKREAAEAEEQRKLAALVTPKLRPSRPSPPEVDGGEPPAPAATDAPAADPVRTAALPPGPPLTSARGHLFAPVAGTVVQRFGKGKSGDLTRQGLLLRTRPGALAIAPHDGIVLYAGPFEGFGRILIIEHGDGYHTLLAGLARVDLSVGSHVLAGEPVGAMAAAGDAAPELYLELRHNGDPIDPLPWFAGLTEKAKG